MFTYQSRILPSMYKSGKTRLRVSQPIFHSRTFRALTFSSIASVIRVNRARYPRRSWRPIMTLSRWIDCKPERGAACRWLFRWTLNDIMKKRIGDCIDYVGIVILMFGNWLNVKLGINLIYNEIYIDFVLHLS